MYFEEILDEIDGFPRTQFLIMLLALIGPLNAATQVYLQMFIQGNEKYRCLIERCENKTDAVYDEKWLNLAVPYMSNKNNQDKIPSHCFMFRYNSSYPNTCDFDDVKDENIKCNKWVYQSLHRTLNKEYELVCERELLLDLSISIYSCGLLVGALVFGVLADKYGRRKVCLFPAIFLIGCLFITSFSPNYYLYTVLRFFIGLCVLGLETATFVLLSDICGKRNRPLLVAISFGRPIGEFYIIGLSYVVHDWRYVQGITCIPALLFILYFRFLPESPRWLISEGKYIEADQEIRKLAMWQGKRQAPIDLLCKLKETKENQTHSKKYFLALLKTPKIRKRFLAITPIWLFGNLITYAISLGAKRLPGDLHTNFSCIAVANTIGITICLFVVRHCGRKASIFVCFSCLQILFFINAFDPPGQHAIYFSALGSFFVAIVYSLTYVYSAELFPTSIRSTAIGTASAFARIGEIFAPFIFNLSDTWLPTPSIILSCGGFICTFIVLLLPETNHEHLPASIDEIEYDDYDADLRKLCSSGRFR